MVATETGREQGRVVAAAVLVECCEQTMMDGEWREGKCVGKAGSQYVYKMMRKAAVGNKCSEE